MSDLKTQLIKLGSTNPELRPHIRKILTSVATIPAVNKALRAAGIDGELVKGRGYFYFKGNDLPVAYTESVYVNRVDRMSIEQWVEEAKRQKKEIKEGRL